MADKFKCLLGLCILSIAICLNGCAQSSVLDRHKNGAPKGGKVSAVTTKAKTPNRVCDLRVQIKINDPIAPYMSDFGLVEVFGKEGFKVSADFPVKFGTQVVIVPELPAGRYTVQASYGTIIATKCVILGCVCIDNWREVFASATVNELKKESASCAGCMKYTTGTGFAAGNYGWTGGATGAGYWGKSNTYSSSTSWGSAQKNPELKGSGQLDVPCSMVTPCSRNVSFEFPDDAKD